MREENRGSKLKGETERPMPLLPGQWVITHVTWRNYGGFTSCLHCSSFPWLSLSDKRSKTMHITDQICNFKKRFKSWGKLQREGIVWIYSWQGRCREVSTWLIVFHICPVGLHTGISDIQGLKGSRRHRHGKCFHRWWELTKAILSEQGEVSKPHSSGIKKTVVEDSWKDRDHV